MEIIRKNDLHFGKVVVSFLLALLVLLSVFLIGYNISAQKFRSIESDQEEIRYDLLSLDIQEELISTCDDSVLYPISSRLEEMGKTLSILEQRFGKNDAGVLDQKEIYTLLQTKHFLNMKKYSQQCGENIDFILFFYSNSDEGIDEAERVGRMLGNLKSNNEESLMVYSFDYNLDIGIIEILTQIYGVEAPNVVVVNEDTIVSDINNIDEIKSQL